ncbi:MAG: pyruvate:ferredoxin (flavodoxin) oxidoreductase, partial [Hyphomonadaceae bacterium]|nr:pyruvate:ferredoxin (flavodoxin) oxidoreductase [Clostridia bacterium]
KAVVEAEKYKGPSIIIAYAPCINHGIKGGMTNSQLEAKKAVEAGYWLLYRFNPDLKEQGKNPFVMDSKAPTASYRDFILGEVRYSSLLRSFPGRADELFDKAAEQAQERYDMYDKMTK